MPGRWQSGSDFDLEFQMIAWSCAKDVAIQQKERLQDYSNSRTLVSLACRMRMTPERVDAEQLSAEWPSAP